MTGGFLQLVSYGSQDFYLTGNPQISFFKTVYRRYTNFSMDFYRINPENNLGLAETATTTYKLRISRELLLDNKVDCLGLCVSIFTDCVVKFYPR